MPAVGGRAGRGGSARTGRRRRSCWPRRNNAIEHPAQIMGYFCSLTIQSLLYRDDDGLSARLDIGGAAPRSQVGPVSRRAGTERKRLTRQHVSSTARYEDLTWLAALDDQWLAADVAAVRPPTRRFLLAAEPGRLRHRSPCRDRCSGPDRRPPREHRTRRSLRAPRTCG